ncbi:hypothetical protein ABZ366_31375, partial [Streptomyces sp. NPDC005904]
MNASHQPDPRERPARLTVGVVGAGRVGPALAASLQLAGHRPVAVSGVSDTSVRRFLSLGLGRRPGPGRRLGPGRRRPLDETTA